MESGIFDSLDVWRAAQADLLNEHTRTLDWFDVNLSETIASDANTADRIKALLVASARTRVQLLLHDDTFFWRHCHRLASLMSIYGHMLELKLTADVDRRAEETFLITDTAVVRRFHADSPRGELGRDARSRILCKQAFNAMWARAELPQEGRRLGI